MIAANRSRQGKRLGSGFAVDAQRRTLIVAGDAGLKLVVLDVFDSTGNVAFFRRMEFYRRLGFANLRDRLERMFITIDTIRTMFGEG